MKAWVNVKIDKKIEKTTYLEKSHIVSLDKDFPVSRIRGILSINELIPNTQIGGDEDTFSNKCSLLIESGYHKLKITKDELIVLNLEIGQSILIDPNKLDKLYEVTYTFDKYYHRYIYSYSVKRDRLIELLKEHLLEF